MNALCTLLSIALCSSVAFSSSTPGNDPPHNVLTTGSVDCQLRPTKEKLPQDVSDEDIKKLYHRCKGRVRAGEIDRALKLLHELQSEEQESKPYTRVVQTQNVVGDLHPASREVLQKHAKSYGTVDTSTGRSFAYGELYFSFDSEKDEGELTGHTYAGDVNVLASGSARKCTWMLFFWCIGPYTESNILVGVTNNLCRSVWVIWPFWQNTKCSDEEHRVHFTYTDSIVRKGFSCKCIAFCDRCTQ